MPAPVDARERPSLATDSFEGDVRYVLGRLKAVGLDQVIVFDLTLPGFDVSVVRVVVPGLEGYVIDYYSPGPRAVAFSKGE
jgi:ribosomal protein S12 methylthiotransferase accessory factor